MNQLGIFIISCDKYSDIWNPFFKMFFKYWADCIYPIYLCSDSLTYNHFNVKSITVGTGLTWSQCLKYGLENCPHDYIMLLQEDYIVHKKVNNEEINRFLNIAIQTQAACIKLVPFPAPDTLLAGYQDVGIISKNTEYRVSTQAAIWNRKALLSLIYAKENPWQFEHNATKRSNQIDYLFLSICQRKKSLSKFYINYPYHYFLTSVVAGKWKRIAVRICKENDVDVDLSKRQIEGFWNMVYYDYAPLPFKHIMDFVANRFLKKKYWGYNS